MSSSNKPRIRDYGITVGTLPPGEYNAITDVPGVKVGHLTLIKGDYGHSDPVIRTGITLVSPAPDILITPRYTGIWALNGAGEMSGSHMIEEYGKLDGVVAITGTLNVGAVIEGLQRLYLRQKTDADALPFHIPTVAETLDFRLTDTTAFPVKPEHVLDIKLADGPVPEGNVGGGTGMISYSFKGGIGTSSRLIPVGPDGKQYTLGVIVQANHGRARNLTIKGVPVGKIMWDEGYWDDELEVKEKEMTGKQLKDGDGSVITIIATDVPLLPHQLKRLAKRAALGLGRQGAMGENFSGDIFLAFSTSPPHAPPSKADSPTVNIPQGRDEKYPFHLPVTIETVQTVADETIDVLFMATADATEEAVLNALAAAETMTGLGGFTAKRLPMDKVKKMLQDHKAI